MANLHDFMAHYHKHMAHYHNQGMLGCEGAGYCSILTSHVLMLINLFTYGNEISLQVRVRELP